MKQSRPSISVSVSVSVSSIQFGSGAQSLHRVNESEPSEQNPCTGCIDCDMGILMLQGGFLDSGNEKIVGLFCILEQRGSNRCSLCMDSAQHRK